MKVIIGFFSKILGLDDKATSIIDFLYHFNKDRCKDSGNFFEKYGKTIASAVVIVVVIILSCIKK